MKLNRVVIHKKNRRHTVCDVFGSCAIIPFFCEIAVDVNVESSQEEASFVLIILFQHSYSYPTHIEH